MNISTELRSFVIAIYLLHIFTNGNDKMALNIRYENRYGPNYGKEWIYFPDGDDIPHHVNLTLKEHVSTYFETKESRADVLLEFRLYTKNNTRNYIRLDSTGKPWHDLSIDIGTVLSNKPIKIITHGWRATADKSCVVNIKNTYLKTQDTNVIAIDWRSIAYNFYVFVSYESWHIGVKLAEFIDNVHELYNISGDQIHLIGHSLGAHIMGVAGHVSKVREGRITGLDPALPLFNNFLSDNPTKLDASDAQYVDVIHTCGGLLGFLDALGTADFFPNGGVAPQPGCDLTVQNIIEGCSHGRAHIYFEESIRNPKAFPTYKCFEWTTDLENTCDKVGYMGEPANLTGIFYLKTNSQEPYGRGV